jgi:hypothetical protein
VGFDFLFEEAGVGGFGEAAEELELLSVGEGVVEYVALDGADAP